MLYISYLIHGAPDKISWFLTPLPVLWWTIKITTLTTDDKRLVNFLPTKGNDIFDNFLILSVAFLFYRREILLGWSKMPSFYRWEIRVQYAWPLSIQLKCLYRVFDERYLCHTRDLNIIGSRNQKSPMNMVPISKFKSRRWKKLARNTFSFAYPIVQAAFQK